MQATKCTLRLAAYAKVQHQVQCTLRLARSGDFGFGWIILHSFRSMFSTFGQNGDLKALISQFLGFISVQLVSLFRLSLSISRMSKNNNHIWYKLTYGPIGQKVVPSYALTRNGPKWTRIVIKLSTMHWSIFSHNFSCKLNIKSIIIRNKRETNVHFAACSERKSATSDTMHFAACPFRWLWF